VKKHAIVILKTIVSLGLLGLIFTRIDFHKAWVQFHYLSWPFIVFALLFYTGCQWLSCLRWQVILESSDHPVPMSNLLSSYFAGMFLNIFLPGALGGDVYRIYRTSKVVHDSEVALVSVFLERFTGLAALSALALMGLPPVLTLIKRWDIILVFLACVSALVISVLLITSPRLLIWAEPWLQKFHLSGVAARFAKIQILLRKFAQHRRALALSMGLSLLLQLAIVYYHYLIAQQLKIPISYLELLIFIPIIVVITLLPISLGGLGLKEGLWIYLFSRVGLTAEQALFLSFTITALSWLLSLPGAMILLLDSTGFKYATRNSK
jgi:glycosyltransferase 2 family protein